MLDALVIDKGIDAGIMKSMGKALQQTGAIFLLLGIAARGTVFWPFEKNANADLAAPESNHRHFILGPGNQWSDESSGLSPSCEQFLMAVNRQRFWLTVVKSPK